MTHRKEEHPSHKVCRYFLKGACNFNSEECWYLHETRPNSENNLINSETNTNSFQCFVCKNDFMSKFDLMEHKKKHQTRKVTTGDSVSPAPSAWTKPLHSAPQQDFPQPPPTAAPDQEALMVTLNMINQRLQMIENRMFPQVM